MPLRYDQRQHIIRSLDNFVYQLITLSFLLSPSFLSYVFRVLLQFQFSKPRELDPHRSLRFWYILIILIHGTSVWGHAVEGATHGRSVILDFVGQSSSPSKWHLILLDFAIIVLNMVLTSVAYETELHKIAAEDTPDPLLPTPPATCASPTILVTGIDHPSQDSPYVLDLRIGQILHRLRSPAPPPPQRASTDALLPLPITTPWQLTAQLQTLMRARARIRDRARASTRTEAGGQGLEEGAVVPANDRRTVPGGLDATDVT